MGRGVGSPRRCAASSAVWAICHWRVSPWASESSYPGNTHKSTQYLPGRRACRPLLLWNVWPLAIFCPNEQFCSNTPLTRSLCSASFIDLHFLELEVRNQMFAWLRLFINRSNDRIYLLCLFLNFSSRNDSLAWDNFVIPCTNGLP